MEQGRAARVERLQTVLRNVPAAERGAVEHALALLRAALTEATSA
jgi:hypothetical protein